MVERGNNKLRRITPIRITKNDRKEYARLARNAKAKVKRTAKNYGVDLRSEIELPDIQNFKTRADFTNWKNKVESFTNRHNTAYQFKKNEYGVVASKKRLNKIARENKAIINKAKKLVSEAENKPFISGGKKQGTVGQQMKQMGKPNAAGVTVPPDFDFSKMKFDSSLKAYEERIEKRSNEKYYDERSARMKDNFIQILGLSFNSDADELIDKLKDIPPDDFYEMYLQFDEFDFDLYDSDGQLVQSDDEASNQVSQMLQYVKMYEQGNVNFDMKGF